MSGPYSKRKRYALDVEAWVQFKLLRLASIHTDTTKADLAVFAEIIQRYKGWSGNGFVSDEEICALTGLADRTVGRARQHLVSLGFVQVVRAGTRGHATVYTPNFSLVPQKGDTDVTVLKGDIPVRELDENVTVSAEYGDTDVTPSYSQDRFLTGPLRDRLDSAPATPPRDAGLSAASGEAPEEDLSLPALLAAYAAADMSKPARAAYKRAWEAIQPDTDLAMVIDRAADWHQSWAQQNNPDAPRMGLVRWLKDEMYLKPAPKGFNKVERPGRTKASVSDKNSKRKPSTPITARVTSSVVVEEGGNAELCLLFTDANGVEHARVLAIQHEDESTQSAAQRQLANLVHAAGLEQIEDSSELLGRSIVLTGDKFTAPSTRPDDEPPLPEKPEPVRYANPPSSPMTDAEIAEIRAKVWSYPPLPRAKPFHITDEERDAWTLDEDDEDDNQWPAWTDADQDDEAA